MSKLNYKNRVQELVAVVVGYELYGTHIDCGSEK
ncbi:hypothetical protein VDT1_2540 [Vibrio sp. 16]|nr:hypothetical protein VDT1_2540 [Vibrio sp. 16]